MGILKNIGKGILFLIIFIVFIGSYFIISFFTWIFPGRCDWCNRKKRNWFRLTIVDERDLPTAICRQCNKEAAQK